jgi:hypothetical protein
MAWAMLHQASILQDAMHPQDAIRLQALALQYSLVQEG